MRNFAAAIYQLPTTIALALKYNTPVLTGDIDLSYVAEHLGVEVIW